MLQAVKYMEKFDSCKEIFKDVHEECVKRISSDSKAFTEEEMKQINYSIKKEFLNSPF